MTYSGLLCAGSKTRDKHGLFLFLISVTLRNPRSKSLCPCKDSVLSCSERVLLEIRNIDHWITKLTLITWDLHLCYTQLEFHIERRLQSFYAQKTLKRWIGTKVSVEEKYFCPYVNAWYTWRHCFSILTVSSITCVGSTSQWINSQPSRFPGRGITFSLQRFLLTSPSFHSMWNPGAFPIPGTRHEFLSKTTQTCHRTGTWRYWNPNCHWKAHTKTSINP